MDKGELNLKKLIPIFVVAGSNVIYHMSAKGTSPTVNPFASMIGTYLISIVLCFVFFYFTSENKSITKEFKKANWATFVLGICLALLEFGNIMMYKLGWNISVGSLIYNIALAVILLFLGTIIYKDKLTTKKIAGAGLCIVGIVLLNI